MTHRDITLGQMQQILNIMRKGEDELTFIIEVLAVILNKSVEEVEAMKVDRVKEMVDDIKDLLMEPKKTLPPDEVEIDGKIYKVTLNMNMLTMGQYVDMQIYINEMQGNSNVIDNAHKLISTLLWDEKAQKTATPEEAKKINFQDAYAIVLFFSEFNCTLKKLIKNYLIKK